MNVKDIMEEGVEIHNARLRREMLGKYASRPLLAYALVRAPHWRISSKKPYTNKRIQMFALIFKGERTHFAVINGWKVPLSEAQAFIEHIKVEKSQVKDGETLRKVFVDAV